MPAKSKEKNTQKSLNVAKFGKKYYDVLEVYSQKIMSQIVERSTELDISKENLAKVSDILNEETTKAKNWGFDQLIKSIRE